MLNIDIRPAEAEDIPMLTTLEHDYQTEYVWQMERLVDANQVSLNFREIRLPRPVHVKYPRPVEMLVQQWPLRSLTLVAEANGQMAGYISMIEQVVPGAVWVMDLAVRAALRRQGVARALIAAGQEWGVYRRYRRIILEMQSKNIPAIRLMDRLGYEFCGYNDYYYPNQDIALFFTRFLH